MEEMKPSRMKPRKGKQFVKDLYRKTGAGFHHTRDWEVKKLGNFRKAKHKDQINEEFNERE